jgi:hypothetical protein
MNARSFGRIVLKETGVAPRGFVELTLLLIAVVVSPPPILLYTA